MYAALQQNQHNRHPATFNIRHQLTCSITYSYLASLHLELLAAPIIDALPCVNMSRVTMHVVAQAVVQTLPCSRCLRGGVSRHSMVCLTVIHRASSCNTRHIEVRCATYTLYSQTAGGDKGLHSNISSM